MCRTHKNYHFIKFLLKISFLAKFLFFFCPLKTRDIFLPSMKLLLDSHQLNFINAFFLNDGQIFILIKNLLKKEIFKNHSNCFLVRLNTSYMCNYFLIQGCYENLVSQLTWFDLKQNIRFIYLISCSTVEKYWF